MLENIKTSIHLSIHSFDQPSIWPNGKAALPYRATKNNFQSSWTTWPTMEQQPLNQHPFPQQPIQEVTHKTVAVANSRLLWERSRLGKGGDHVGCASTPVRHASYREYSPSNVPMETQLHCLIVVLHVCHCSAETRLRPGWQLHQLCPAEPRHLARWHQGRAAYPEGLWCEFTYALHAHANLDAHLELTAPWRSHICSFILKYLS